MTPDSRRSNHKPLRPRSLPVSAEPTIRDLRTETPTKRLLPWMGLILFCTGAVFQAGRLVERLDPQPPYRPGHLPGLLSADVAMNAPGAATAPAEPPHAPHPEKQQAEAEALRKLMAERDQAQENARLAWQKQVEAEVAAQVARMGEESSQQRQLEADEVAQKATQAAAEAEAKVRELEIQLATKSAELQEARLRAENEWLRAELERARADKQEPAGVTQAAAADSPGGEPSPESTPPPPAAGMEPPASPEPPPQPSSSEQPLAPEPAAPAEAKPTI